MNAQTTAPNGYVEANLIRYVYRRFRCREGLRQMPKIRQLLMSSASGSCGWANKSNGLPYGPKLALLISSKFGERAMTTDFHREPAYGAQMASYFRLPKALSLVIQPAAKPPIAVTRLVSETGVA